MRNYCDELPRRCKLSTRIKSSTTFKCQECFMKWNVFCNTAVSNLVTVTSPLFCGLHPLCVWCELGSLLDCVTPPQLWIIFPLISHFFRSFCKTDFPSWIVGCRLTLVPGKYELVHLLLMVGPGKVTYINMHMSESHIFCLRICGYGIV